MKQSGLSQVLRTLVYENLNFVEKFSIKQPLLFQFQIIEALNDEVL